MVNVMELVSKSQKSHKSQRFQGFMFVVQVHSSSSLRMFTSWFHVDIDPEVDPQLSRDHLLQYPR